MPQQYRVANKGASLLYVSTADGELRPVPPGRRVIVGARQRLAIQKTELFKMGLIEIQLASEQDGNIKALLALAPEALQAKVAEIDDTVMLEELLVGAYDKASGNEIATVIEARIQELDVPDLSPQATEEE